MVPGEDPVLGAQMVAPVIKGIQSKGVIANAKHFVMNSQESNRHNVVEEVDERTMFEIYYPPFKAAVDAGAAREVVCRVQVCSGQHDLACLPARGRGAVGRCAHDGALSCVHGHVHTVGKVHACALLDRRIPQPEAQEWVGSNAV